MNSITLPTKDTNNLENGDTWPELGWSEEVTPSSWVKGPHKKQALILDRALVLFKSVPYDVTLRWLFYGLWQEGWYSNVKPTRRAKAKQRAYEDFKGLMGKVRHSSIVEIQERC